MDSIDKFTTAVAILVFSANCCQWSTIAILDIWIQFIMGHYRSASIMSMCLGNVQGHDVTISWCTERSTWQQGGEHRTEPCFICLAVCCKLGLVGVRDEWLWLDRPGSTHMEICVIIQFSFIQSHCPISLEMVTYFKAILFCLHIILSCYCPPTCFLLRSENFRVKYLHVGTGLMKPDWWIWSSSLSLQSGSSLV